MRNLANRVAFVTGGGSGIGLGIVEALLDRGVKVVAAGLGEKHLVETRKALGPRGDFATMQVDVIDRIAMAQAAKRTVDLFGRCDILVNNAGVGVTPSVDSVRYEDWDWVLSVNVGGAINGIMSFLPEMLRRGEGHIVTTSSVAGLLPTSNYIYATSKFAVRGMSDALRLKLAPRGIGVSVVYPGLTRSRILQSGKNRQARFQTEQSAAAIAGDALVPPREAGMQPRDVGEMVVEGIIHNRGYIISHSEFRDEMAEHFDSILAACPPPQDIDPGRLMMENMRRRQTAEAMQAIEALTNADEDPL